MTTRNMNAQYYVTKGHVNFTKYKLSCNRGFPCKPNKGCWGLLLYRYISFVITLLSIDDVMGQIKINKNLLVVTGCHIFGYYNGKFLQAGSKQYTTKFLHKYM